MASGRGSAAIGLAAVAISAALAVSDVSLALPRAAARPARPVAREAPAPPPEREPATPRRQRQAIPGDERVLVPNGRAVTVGQFRSALATSSGGNWSLLEINEVSRSVDVAIEVAAFTHPSRDQACLAAVAFTRDQLEVHHVDVMLHFPWFRGRGAYECPSFATR